VDGVLIDMMSWAYPRPESTAQTGLYVIGDDSEEASMSWCMASATLLSKPLGIVCASLRASTLVYTDCRRPSSTFHSPPRAQV
jgi:hypothetical protein